jgi:hypothetical protein
MKLQAARMTAINQARRTRFAILPLRRRFDPPHGSTAAYQRGCGCALCCRANTIATQARRQRDRYESLDEIR